MKFIVLHRPSDGAPLLINLDHIALIGLDDENKTCVYLDIDRPLFVKETMDRIQWLMRDGGSCK